MTRKIAIIALFTLLTATTITPMVKSSDTIIPITGTTIFVSLTKIITLLHNRSEIYTRSIHNAYDWVTPHRISQRIKLIKAYIKKHGDNLVSKEAAHKLVYHTNDILTREQLTTIIESSKEIELISVC